MEIVTIQESSICEAFMEFFELLPKTDYAVSDDEFQNILRKQLHNLE